MEKCVQFFSYPEILIRVSPELVLIDCVAVIMLLLQQQQQPIRDSDEENSVSLSMVAGTKSFCRDDKKET